jgi:hypothetical protein
MAPGHPLAQPLLRTAHVHQALRLLPGVRERCLPFMRAILSWPHSPMQSPVTRPPSTASDSSIASTLCMHGCVELSGARASPPRHLSYRVALVPCARHVGLWCESNAAHGLIDCPGAPAPCGCLPAGVCLLYRHTYLRTYAPCIHTHAWPGAKLGPGHRTHAPRPPCSRVTRHRLVCLGHESGAEVGGMWHWPHRTEALGARRHGDSNHPLP